MDASKVITELASTTTAAMLLCNQLLAIGTFISAASQDSARLAHQVQSHWRILDELSRRLDHSDAVHHENALAITRQIVSQTLSTFHTIEKVAPNRRSPLPSPSSSIASSRASSSSSVTSMSSLSSAGASDPVAIAKPSPFSFLSNLSRPSSSRSNSGRSTNSHSANSNPKNSRTAQSRSTTNLNANPSSTSSDYVFPIRSRMQWLLKKIEIDALIHQLEFLQHATQLLVLVLTIGEKIKWTRQFAKGGNSMQVMYEVLKVQGTPAKDHLVRDIKGVASVMVTSQTGSGQHQDNEGVVAMLPEFVRLLSQKYAEHGSSPSEELGVASLQEWEVKEYSRENMRRWWTGLLLEWTTIR